MGERCREMQNARRTTALANAVMAIAVLHASAGAMADAGMQGEFGWAEVPVGVVVRGSSQRRVEWSGSPETSPGSTDVESCFEISIAADELLGRYWACGGTSRAGEEASINAPEIHSFHWVTSDREISGNVAGSRSRAFILARDLGARELTKSVSAYFASALWGSLIGGRLPGAQERFWETSIASIERGPGDDVRIEYADGATAEFRFAAGSEFPASARFAWPTGSTLASVELKGTADDPARLSAATAAVLEVSYSEFTVVSTSRGMRRLPRLIETSMVQVFGDLGSHISSVSTRLHWDRAEGAASLLPGGLASILPAGAVIYPPPSGGVVEVVESEETKPVVPPGRIAIVDDAAEQAIHRLGEDTAPGSTLPARLAATVFIVLVGIVVASRRGR